jgi:hypothetical protein
MNVMYTTVATAFMPAARKKTARQLAAGAVTPESPSGYRMASVTLGARMPGMVAKVLDMENTNAADVGVMSKKPAMTPPLCMPNSPTPCRKQARGGNKQCDSRTKGSRGGGGGGGGAAAASEAGAAAAAAAAVVIHESEWVADPRRTGAQAGPEHS